MGKINGGYSAFSSGPKTTQAVPVAQQTPLIPTEYGIPTMAKDSFATMDPRTSDVPAFATDFNGMSEKEERDQRNDEAYKKAGYGKKSPLPNPEGPETKASTRRSESQNEHDMGEDAVSPEKVQTEIRGPNQGGQFSAHAKHDKDRAMRGGFPDAKSAHKWSSTMQRKIARQSLSSDEVPDDSDMSMAQDFNPKLHEHFKTLREHKMMPIEGVGEEDFSKKGEKSKAFIGSKGKYAVLHHNSKTGGVRAETGPGEESWASNRFTNSPKILSKNLRQAEQLHTEHNTEEE